MSEKRICDNCQNIIFNTQVYFKIKQISNGNDIYKADKKVELCSDCAKQFIELDIFNLI